MLFIGRNVVSVIQMVLFADGIRPIANLDLTINLLNDADWVQK